jgi:hypothetical protein
VQGERFPLPADLCVPPRNRDVVQEDLALWVATDRGRVGVDEELAPRVRATLDDQHPASTL